VLTVVFVCVMGLSCDGLTALTYAAVGPSRWCLVAEINLGSEGNIICVCIKIEREGHKESRPYGKSCSASEEVPHI
jgi:hypothetical protein